MDKVRSSDIGRNIEQEEKFGECLSKRLGEIFDANKARGFVFG
jgi:hypothetical protein